MKRISILIISSLAVLLFFSCTGGDNRKVRMAYTNWTEGIAVTYLAKEILNEKGYDVELLNADVAPIFASLAGGKADVFMDCWLPDTHADYYRKYGEKLDVIGTVFDSARIGLVVPAYVPVTEIDELNQYRDRFNGEITGVDAGTGIMKSSARVIDRYGLGFKLMVSNSTAMTALLKKAIEKRDWIVVTGWTPHWMFDCFNLRMLEDPEGVYGQGESIHTITRKGFTADQPYVAELLGNISLSQEELCSLMQAIEVHKGGETEAVRQWMSENRTLVESWIPEQVKP